MTGAPARRPPRTLAGPDGPLSAGAPPGAAAARFPVERLRENGTRNYPMLSWAFDNPSALGYDDADVPSPDGVGADGERSHPSP